MCEERKEQLEDRSSTLQLELQVPCVCRTEMSTWRLRAWCHCIPTSKIRLNCTCRGLTAAAPIMKLRLFVGRPGSLQEIDEDELEALKADAGVTN